MKHLLRLVGHPNIVRFLHTATRTWTGTLGPPLETLDWLPCRVIGVNWHESMLILEKGDAIDSLIESGALRSRPHCVQRYCEDMTAAVAHLHQLEPPLIHNDLKPSNCIVKSNQRCALIDFGISGVAGSIRVCRGTQGFVTPRPIDPNGEPMHPRNDLYALGRTIEMTLVHPALAAYHQALVAQCKHDSSVERPTAMELLTELQSVWSEGLGEDGVDTKRGEEVKALWEERKMHITLVSVDKSPKGRHARGEILREQAQQPHNQAGQAAGVLMVGGVTGACLIGAAAAVDEWQVPTLIHCPLRHPTQT